VDPLVHIGLGTVSRIDSVHVIWPGGKYETLKDISLRTQVVVKESEATSNWNYHRAETARRLFADPEKFAHARENTFTPFNVERLLPHSVAAQGPKLSVADVNNDRLEDVFVGGAAGFSGSLLLQKRAGGFQPSSATNVFMADSSAEDAGSCFFDADGDGDADLVVAGGGQQFSEDDVRLQPRLYFNDGRGNFRKGINNFPLVFTDASCVRSCDMDNDGDQDLFIGGRVIAGKYGIAPSSYLLLNDGKGHFSAVSDDKFLRTSGMVTDAQWVDFNKDKLPDLVIAGEWIVEFFNSCGY
jgi:hypothetical protein